MDVCSSKLGFYSCPARKFWTFLTDFSDIKTSVWALTETLDGTTEVSSFHFFNLVRQGNCNYILSYMQSTSRRKAIQCVRPMKRRVVKHRRDADENPLQAY